MALGTDRAIGILLTAIAASLWALGYFVRSIIAQDISAFLLTALISAVATATLAIWHRVSPTQALQLIGRQPLRYTSVAFLGVVLGNSLMFVGLSRLPLGIAAVLEKLQPVFTLGAARLILGDPVTRSIAAWASVTVAASCVVAAPNVAMGTVNFPDAVGVISVVAAALAWATAGVVGKQCVENGATGAEVALARFLLGTILTLPIAIMEAPYLDVSLRLAAMVAFLGVVASAFSYVAYYEGLKRLRTGTSAFVELITPAVAVGLGSSVLGETFTAAQVVAIPVMLLAVYRIALVLEDAGK